MTTIMIDIPTEIESTVIDTFCLQNGYQEEVWAENAIDHIPNPESKIDFMTKILYNYVIESVKFKISLKAAEDARVAASYDFDVRIASPMNIKMEEVIAVSKQPVEFIAAIE
jgi:hypothetical protein